MKKRGSWGTDSNSKGIGAASPRMKRNDISVEQFDLEGSLAAKRQRSGSIISPELLQERKYSKKK